jgi:hypothetical protein
MGKPIGAHDSLIRAIAAIDDPRADRRPHAARLLAAGMGQL